MLQLCSQKLVHWTNRRGRIFARRPERTIAADQSNDICVARSEGLTTSGWVVFSKALNKSSRTSASRLSSFFASGRRKVATIWSVSVRKGWSLSMTGEKLVGVRGDHWAQDVEDAEVVGEKDQSGELGEFRADALPCVRAGAGGERGAWIGGGDFACSSASRAKNRAR